VRIWLGKYSPDIKRENFVCKELVANIGEVKRQQKRVIYPRDNNLKKEKQWEGVKIGWQIRMCRRSPP
jgi:hypothetical protein